jgi:mannose-6-phosphate isomerase-like protein (cupin superfamily)
MKKAVYVQVDEVEAHPTEGCRRTLRKHLLASEHLEIGQIILQGPGDAEEYGVAGVDRMQYVLEGQANLVQGGGTTEVGPGHLLVVPAGAPGGPGLSVRSDGLTLLEIAARQGGGGGGPRPGSRGCESIRVIRPEDIRPYQPAGHAKTVNRCLFENEAVEIIEGSIEAGGGAEEHLHEEHEQMLYVLEGSERPLLIYYPKGTPHGTGGGIAVPLRLLVIYAPPLGEAASVLR